MIKKFFLAFLLILTIVLVFLTTTTSEQMVISETEFSEETQDVLSLLDSELIFYDVIFDETVHSYSLNVWYHNGTEWVDYGGSSGLALHIDNQIAVQVTDDECISYRIDDNGYSKATIDLEQNYNDYTTVVSNKIDTDPTTIVLNTEIPLYGKFATNENTFRSVGLDQNFRETECDMGIVVTLTVSDQAID